MTPRRGLMLKAGCIVILVEALALAGLGLLSFRHFSREVDRNLEARVQLPGDLMQQQLLRYEAVADVKTMTSLVGDEFVEGMVVGDDASIYYATNASLRGGAVGGASGAGLQTLMARRLASGDREKRILRPEDGRLLCITPLVAFEGARPFFHVIVEVQTRDAEARKRRIAMLFALGAAGCVVVTSLGIILFMDRHISRPIKALEASANALARGEPDCCERGAASCNCLDIRRGDELGNLARAFLSMRDAIRGAIRQLEEANSQLRQLDQLKSDFLSSVSHELRTPLTSLLGYAKLTARHFTRHFQPLASGDEMLARKADTIAGNLAVMVSEGERLTRLINDVLDLNKIESGRMPWRDATLACREVMDRVARTVEPLARQHPRVRLLLPAPEPELAIHADPDSVQQLLLNLLHNAFKFTRQGSITLMARPGAEGFVVFTVADTGMGIAQADLPRLFDKFSQAHGGDTMPDAPAGVEGVGGSGLGLAICKEIVTHYGGVIWVESRLGAGSAFHCTLPRASLPAGDRPAGD